ncbi:MAG: carboxypeptidase-like regulatory domain-containing protein [Bacteroidales bacterium]|nr:carboxypeptidase-like regulatory domain-containing protein [Bacteroidales bacterium]
MISTKIVICIISFLTFCKIHAQVLEGTVYDSRTRETIPGVVIYLDGTSTITTSDRDGNFRLVVNQAMNADLIFSHLSYESLVIKPPFERLEKAFFLREKTNILQEARVVAEREWFPREAKMKVFKEQFLGMSAAGQSCIIVNEDDIVLSYSRSTNTLTGYSLEPIIVENRYLAYRVTFDLRSFSIQYTEHTLSMEKAISVSFKGTSSFVDQSPYNIRFKTRRDETHLRSSRYFFKNLVDNTLEESKFRIFNRLTKIDTEQYFVITSASPRRTVLIIPHTNLRRSHDRVMEGPVYGVINIMDERNFRSELVFLTNRFSVDEFGNPDTIDNLMFFGRMGEQRLGDMLPRDYTYSPPSQTPQLR